MKSKKYPWLCLLLAGCVASCFFTGCRQTEPIDNSSRTSIPTVSSQQASSAPVASLPAFSSTASSQAFAIPSLLDEKIIVDSVGDADNIFYLTSEGEVLVQGDNSEHQLGSSGVSVWHQPLLYPFPEPIKLISRRAAVGESNTIYFWGSNTVKFYTNNPVYGSVVYPVKFNKEIIQISNCPRSGDAIILAADGTVYSVGEGAMYGYTVIKSPSEKVHELPSHFFTPVKIQVPEKIKAVSSNLSAFFLLGESGTVYSAYSMQWTLDLRYNTHYSISLPILSQFPYPYTKQVFQKMDLPEKVAQINGIGVGRHYSENNNPSVNQTTLYMLTEDGNVYYWEVGWEISEQISIANSENTTFSPPNPTVHRLDITEKVTLVVSDSDKRTIFFTEDGGAYIQNKRLYGEALKNNPDNLPEKYVGDVSELIVNGCPIHNKK